MGLALAIVAVGANLRRDHELARVFVKRAHLECVGLESLSERL
jgi:hypothetical protein